MMMYYFIVNPNAGSRKGMRCWEEIKPYLLEEGIVFRELLTKGEGDAARFAERITEKGRPDVIVAVGGDGTLHETVSGMKKEQRRSLLSFPQGPAMTLPGGWGIQKTRKRDSGAS